MVKSSKDNQLQDALSHCQLLEHKSSKLLRELLVLISRPERTSKQGVAGWSPAGRTNIFKGLTLSCFSGKIISAPNRFLQLAASIKINVQSAATFQVAYDSLQIVVLTGRNAQHSINAV